jgi:hypothetical protein
MATKQTQFGWQVCGACGGLFFTGRGHTPTCKAGDGRHAHVTAGNTNRGVMNVPNTYTDNLPDQEEGNWRFCGNCYGLFRVFDNSDYGWCNHAKTGKAHVAEANSSFYVLSGIGGVPTTPADIATAYYECSKCGGLFHDWPNGTACNAGGQHEKAADQRGGKYFLLMAKQ